MLQASLLPYMYIHVRYRAIALSPGSNGKEKVRDLKKALGILSEAEEALSTLMREALADQRYDDVATVAEATQLLTDLVGSLESPSRKDRDAGLSGARTRREETPASGAGLPGTQNPRKEPRRVPSGAARGEPSGSYPQFAKDGDRLVKVGWSSKVRREYEHRTHRKVLRVFARVVRDRPEAADCFTMDDVLPLVYAGGKEIPSYQAYLALAWLRRVEAIRKEGRDGYRADLFKLSDESLKSLWESLPEHV